MVNKNLNNGNKSSTDHQPPKKPWGIKKKLLAVAIIVIIILSVAGVYYSFYLFPPRIEKISYEFIESNEGTYVLFKVKVSGSLLFHEGSLSNKFYTYFGNEMGGGGNSWDPGYRDGEYQEKLGPFDDGTEIWFMAYVTSGGSYHWRDITARINKPLATNQDKGLSIEEVNYEHKVLKLGEGLNVTVNVKGTLDNGTERTDVGSVSRYIVYSDSKQSGVSGGSCGGGGIFELNNYTICVGSSSARGMSSYSGILMFRVYAHDTNRTVVSKTHILKIED